MRQSINPLALIACKQRVGQEDADSIALPILIHFDAAKRGQCTAAGANFLVTHLIIASYIAARTKSKAFHDLVTAAYAQLKKASDRPTKLLDLTTNEYATLRKAIGVYLRSMPSIEVGVMDEACKVAQRMMG